MTHGYEQQATFEELEADDAGDPTPYQLICDQARQDQMLRMQVAKHGEEASRSSQSAGPEGSVQSFALSMPGAAGPREKAEPDPLKTLMAQMGLSRRPPISAGAGITGTKKAGTSPGAGTKKAGTSGAVKQLTGYDTRGVCPIDNPMKSDVQHPASDAHGLCLSASFCGVWLGGVSSGKTTCLLSALGHNHGQWRYDHVWLMHPDAEGALKGEYQL